VHKIPLFNAVTGAEHSVLFSQQQVITLKYGQCSTQFGCKSRIICSFYSHVPNKNLEADSDNTSSSNEVQNTTMFFLTKITYVSLCRGCFMTLITTETRECKPRNLCHFALRIIPDPRVNQMLCKGNIAATSCF
jgi:hypothetical protein